MSIWPAFKNPHASRWALFTLQFLARLLPALMLAVCLGPLLGTGLAQADAHRPAVAPSLTFIAPNTQGLIGGPPGAKTTVRGASWSAYSSVALYVKPGIGACASGVSLGAFPTDSTGSLTAHFLWPAGANRLAGYYVCGIQTDKGVSYSRNTFTVLATSAPKLSATPSSATAGATLTVSGSNWVPGPQTVSLIILPCPSLCTQTAVASGQVVTDQQGAFSLQMTLSAQAAGGTYYVQATNGQTTLSAVSAAIQVTGQGAAGGTPVSASPTSAATPGSQGDTSPTANNTLPALKAGLIAAALGIAGLALLIGGGIVLLRITRSGKAALPGGRQRTPAARHLERLRSNNAYGKPAAPEWQSPYRANYPDRFALPPVAGSVRGEQSAHAGEPEREANIWEGVTRPAPDIFQMPPSSFPTPAPRSAPEQKASPGQPANQEYQEYEG
jgi:hypothetical protein